MRQSRGMGAIRPELKKRRDNTDFLQDGKRHARRDNTDFTEYASGGLYENIHAKRKRIAAGSGEKMRKPGSPGAAPLAAHEVRLSPVSVPAAPALPVVPSSADHPVAVPTATNAYTASRLSPAAALHGRPVFASPFESSAHAERRDRRIDPDLTNQSASVVLAAAAARQCHPILS